MFAKITYRNSAGNIAEQVLAFTQNHNSDLENDN